MVLDSLSAAVSNLEAASTGPSVKTALIDLADTLNALAGADTEKLGNQPQNYYVLQSEIDALEKKIDTWLVYVEKPNGEEKDTAKVIKNKDLTKCFGNFLIALRKINGDKDGDIFKVPEDQRARLIGNNLTECMRTLQDTFGLIEDAINEKATSPESHVQETDSIEDFATRIKNILISVLDVQPYTVTDKDDYKDLDVQYDEHGNIISGKAWNPVTLNIQLKGEDCIATSTGTISPSEGYDGIKSVKVEVPDSGSGYGSGSGSGSGDIDGELNLTTIEITENGNYDKPSNYDGYSEVNVNVQSFELPEDKEFTVRFLTDHLESKGNYEEWDSVTVHTGDTAVCGKGDPSYQTNLTDYPDEGYYFVGWDPEPRHVVSDLDCKAMYRKWTKVPYGYVTDDLEMSVGNWYDFLEGSTSPGKTVKFIVLKNNTYAWIYKVGSIDGNDIWMFLNPLSANGNNIGASWSSSTLREYLNGDFITNVLPDWMVRHLASVEIFSRVPVAAAPSAFELVNSATSFASMYFDTTNHLSSPIFRGTDSTPIWGTQLESSVDSVFVPSVYEVGAIDSGYLGDFTSDVYSSDQYSTTRYGNFTYNPYDRIGRKKNATYPRNMQTGLFYKNDRSIASNIKTFGLISKSPTGNLSLVNMQNSYKPATFPKNTDPRIVAGTIAPECQKIDMNSTFIRSASGAGALGAGLSRGGMISQDIRLRDVFIYGCSRTNDKVHTVVDEQHEGNYWEEWDYSDAETSVTYGHPGLSPEGYLVTSSSSLSTCPCVALKKGAVVD